MWVRDLERLGQDSRGSARDSGEACGKHGTQRHAKALVVRHVVRQIVQGMLKQC